MPPDRSYAIGYCSPLGRLATLKLYGTNGRRGKMNSMKHENLKLLITAGNPIISISTPDEPRAVHTVHEVAQSIGVPVSVWSLTEGLQPCGVEQVLVEAGKPAAALKYVKDSDHPAIYLFKDLGQHAKDPQILRYLRDLYFSPVSRPWTLILLDPIAPPDRDAQAEPAV